MHIIGKTQNDMNHNHNEEKKELSFFAQIAKIG
jgi:hypothetical protein